MTDVKAFIRKWNGRTLEDDGFRVSKEFHSFQVAFFNAMRKIAKSLGGEVVKPTHVIVTIRGINNLTTKRLSNLPHCIEESHLK